jgi:hypothetical protein
MEDTVLVVKGDDKSIKEPQLPKKAYTLSFQTRSESHAGIELYTAAEADMDIFVVSNIGCAADSSRKVFFHLQEI